MRRLNLAVDPNRPAVPTPYGMRIKLDELVLISMFTLDLLGPYPALGFCLGFPLRLLRTTRWTGSICTICTLSSTLSHRRRQGLHIPGGAGNFHKQKDGVRANSFAHNGYTCPGTYQKVVESYIGLGHIFHLLFDGWHVTP